MKSEDSIEKNISGFLNLAIKNDDFSFDIRNPDYQSQYFEIFFKGIENNGEPPHGDRLSDQLENLVIGEEKVRGKILESFYTVWNGWVELYRELRRRNFIFS